MHLHGLEESARQCYRAVALMLVMLGVVDVTVGVHGESCGSAYNTCNELLGCGVAMRNLHFNCLDIIEGRNDVCSPGCRKALIALLTTEDEQGKRIMTCDCGNDTYCREKRQYLQICSEEVLEALENLNNENVMISCSLAQLICEADTSCNEALGFYMERCSRMFLGDKCTERCNNSQSILFRRHKARKLRTCTCDGTSTDILWCERVRENTERLCLAPAAAPHVRHSGKHNHTRTHQGEGHYNLKNITHSSVSWTKEVDVDVRPGRASALSWTWTLILASILTSLGTR